MEVHGESPLVGEGLKGVIYYKGTGGVSSKAVNAAFGRKGEQWLGLCNWVCVASFLVSVGYIITSFG